MLKKSLQMKKILIITLLLLYFSGRGQVKVYPLSDMESVTGKTGFIYSLPETRILIHLRVKKTEHYKGPYADYARKYLNINNIIKNDHYSYEIIDVQLEREAIPDPNQIFFVEIPKKGKTSLGFHLSPEGFLSNMTGVENEKEMREISEKYLQHSFRDIKLFKYQNASNLVETTDTILRRIIIDTIEVSKMFFQKKWTLKGSENNAREAAKMIEKLKTARYNLLTGYQEVAYDGAAIKYMDSQLQQMEEEYLSMFSGATIEKEITYTFSVIPKKSDENMIPAFTFSKRTGAHRRNSNLGDVIHLTVEEVASPNNPMTKFDTQSDKLGIYYRIPVWADVRLEVNDDISVQAKYPFPQWGRLARLPANIRSVSLDENTGNVKSVLFK